MAGLPHTAFNKDQRAVEKQQADERFAAEEKRQADLWAADTEAKQKQADTLVRSLGTADTALVPRLIEELK